MKNVYFAVPAYGGQVHARFANSLLELTHILRQRNVGFHIAWQTGESHVGRARNTSFSQYVLEPRGAGCLQFLDTDLVFSAATMADHLLVVLAGNAPGCALLGGSYPTKRLYPGAIRNALLGGLDTEAALIAGLRNTVRLPGGGADGAVVDGSRLVETLYTPQFTWMRALWLPTGLMTVPLGVAQRLAEHYRGRMYKTDGGEDRWDLFPTLPHQLGSARILLSEDYAFCQLAAEAGVESWYNANLGAAHIGSYTYGVAT